MSAMDRLVPALRELVDFWQACFTDGKAPSYSALRFSDVARWLPNLGVVKVQNPSETSQIVFFGAKCIELLGADWTSRKISEAVHPSQRAALVRVLDEVRHSRTPAVLRAQSMRPEAAPIVLERLLLPYLDEDGTVSHVLFALWPLPDLRPAKGKQ
jgi:hypothetical protein